MGIKILTSLDKFGRVIIPKPIREHLGLQPGAMLEIEEVDHQILLKLHDEPPYLKREEGFLVFIDKPTRDLIASIEKLREDRFKSLEE